MSKMLKLCALLALMVLALGLAQGASPRANNKHNGHKEPCCMPEQWEGFVSEDIVSTDRQSGQQSETAYRAMLAMDSTKKLSNARTELWQEDGLANISLTIDFNSKVMYIANFTNKWCRKVAVKDEMTDRCVITKDASYIASVFLGSKDNGMDVDVWQVKVKKVAIPMEMELSMMVNPDTCLPVVQGGKAKINYGPGVDISFSVSMVNMESKISDPEIFNPPSFCKDAKEIPFPVAMAEPHISTFYYWSVK